MAATPVRHPAVAGRFYPEDPATLRQSVENFLSQNPRQTPVRAVGCVAPHAGYVYSGMVAGAVFASLEIPEVCVVLGPNHTGRGRPLAIMSEGGWETPLGLVAIDTLCAAALRQRYTLLEEDSAAHHFEHAIEVELPFLQVRQPNLAFVPIAVGTRNFEVLEQLGLAVAEVIAAQRRPILMVASSDMNHYESDAMTRIKDLAAIDPILALEPRILHEVVMERKISMCGFAPTLAMLIAARKLGATSGELVRYATSGDISGDRDRVVGYAGIAIV